MAKLPKLSFLTSPLAKQYIIWVFILGTLLSLLASLFELYLKFDNLHSTASNQLNRVSNTYVSGLSRALWEFNDPQVNDILAGINRSTNVTRATVETPQESFGFGEERQEPYIEIRNSLFHQYRGEDYYLGTLALSVNLKPQYTAIGLATVSEILINTLKVIVLIGFSFFVFQMLVNRHLEAIVNHASRGVEPALSGGILQLSRNQFAKGENDELDGVVNGLNSLYQEIRRLHADNSRALEQLANESESRLRQLEFFGATLSSIRQYVSFYDAADQVIYQSSILPQDAEILGSFLSIPIRTREHLLQLVSEHSPVIQCYPSSTQHVDGRKVDIHKIGIRTASQRYFDMYLVCFENGNLAAIAVDSTILRRIENDLQQANKLQAMGTMAASVAHEFNNALAVISGACELVRTRIGNESAISGYVDRIEETVRTNAETIAHILPFSKSDAEERQGEFLDIRKLIQGAIENVQTFNQLGINILIDVDYDRKVYVNQSGMVSTLVNLLKNAIESMDFPGSIQVHVDRIIGSEYRDVFNDAHEYLVRISVDDEGEGISIVHDQKLFEPFFSTKADGSGMGLWFSHEFIREQGGKLLYSPIESGGSRFTILLPELYEQVLEKPEFAIDVRGGTSIKVLVVEDNQSLCSFIEEYFQAHSRFLVNTAGSVQQARKELAEGLFDVCLVDLQLPDGSGLSVCRFAKEGDSDMRCMLMTGNIERIVKVRDEVDLVLAKPLDFHQLVGEIEAQYQLKLAIRRT